MDYDNRGVSLLPQTQFIDSVEDVLGCPETGGLPAQPGSQDKCEPWESWSEP